MADELIDVIDKNNKVVRSEMKSIVHEKGLRHRISAVLVKNIEGKYLIPTASQLKEERGKLFHSAAGHIASGESYLKAATRELWEECGLKTKESDLTYLGTFWAEKDYPTRKEKERFEVFEAKYNETRGKIILNEEQVDEKWFSDEELRDIYKDNTGRFSNPLRLTCEKIFKY